MRGIYMCYLTVHINFQQLIQAPDPAWQDALEKACALEVARFILVVVRGVRRDGRHETIMSGEAFLVE